MDENTQEQAVQPEAEAPATTPTPTVVQTEDWRSELKAPWDDKATTLQIPLDNDDNNKAIIDDAPKLNYEKSPAIQHWARVALGSSKLLPPHHQFLDRLSRPSSRWEQGLTTPSGRLGPRMASFAEGGPLVSGELAVIRARALLGKGGLITIPLYHSGFWITLKTPSDSAVLDLDQAIARETEILGRMTGGAVFSNLSVFVAKHFMSFIRDHIYTTTLKNEEDLYTKIRLHDLQALAWGMGLSIWPKGFQYERPARAAVDGEMSVIREFMNLSKVFWVDNAGLTPQQQAHMISVQVKSKSDESIEVYRDGFGTTLKARVELAEGFVVHLAVPSVGDYIDSGQRWVSEITSLIDAALGMDPENNDRENLIFAQGKATHMRQFGHWVDAIEAFGQRYDDQATIETMLSEFSGDDDIREKFFKEVNRFIGDSAIAIMAVPALDEEERNVYPRYPLLVPIDAMVTFFTLLDQKVLQIIQR